ncbi:1-phosphofructokinase family hexose kinase [Actinoplanes sp. NPDC051494]|uniref:1-phosphofructokinase family hexose kinase n=1 Tax=Actinoplanes sp. NPDC051494 TaxID=3363907 RepID=UPI0037A1C71C
MIITVTLNPALDLTYTVDALVPHGTHRVSSVAERPGGKGLNVAAVLHSLGEPVLATGLLGGTTGGRVSALLAVHGVPNSFVSIAGETRRTVAVADGVDATGFWEPGPTVSEREWTTFLERFGQLVGETDVVAFSGSLPPGVPVDGYATLIRLASAAGAATVLDTSGDALRLGLAASPDLAKPNAHELAELLAAHRATSPGVLGARETKSPHSVAVSQGGPDAIEREVRAASEVRAAKGEAVGGRTAGDWVAADVLVSGVGAVVVSRGPLGLLAVTAGGTWEAVPSERLDGNPTGAGDACVAALARGLRDRTPWAELVADAVALSAAAVASPVAGAVDLDTYRRLLPAVVVTGPI